MARPFMNLQIAQEIVNYRMEHTIKETADNFGLKPVEIRNVLWVFGSHPPSNCGKRRDSIKDIVEMLNNGIPPKEIYQKLRISKQAFSHLLYRYGYELKYTAAPDERTTEKVL